MEEENGLSFGEICKIILKKIWWVVGSMAVCALIVVLVVQLWYNKKQHYYTVNYEIVYPDSSSGKYPDGSALLAAESVSLSTLQSIVNQAHAPEYENELEGIKVEDMVKNDGITIKESLSQSADGTIRRSYTLTVKSKYFKSGKQASSFLRQVAAYPVVKVNAQIASKDYGLYFPVYENAHTYEDKIEALLSQKQYLVTNYNAITIADGSVSLNLAQLNNLFTAAQRQALQDTITAKYYVYDTDGYKSAAENRKAALQKQIDDNQKIIEELIAKRNAAATDLAASGQGMTGDNEYDTQIASLTVKNGELENERTTIQTTLDEIEKYTKNENQADYEGKQKFDALLESYRAQLETATQTLKTTSVNVYKNNSNVIFESNVITEEGGMNIIIAAILGLVIGLVVSSVVICIIDVPKYKKAKLAAGGAETAKARNEGAEDETQDAGKNNE